MSDAAVYFPNINLPREAWVARALLYWDHVKVLAPRAVWEGKPHHYHPYMERLTDAGLVQRLEPRDYVTPELSAKFVSALLEAPDREERRASFAAGRHVKVHLDKLEARVRDALLQERLAAFRGSAEQGESWMDVDERTAVEYTASIAVSVHQEDPSRPMPITAGISGGHSQTTGAQLTLPVDQATERSALRELLLRNVLPYPEGGLNVDEVIAFRIDHSELAGRLRRQIEKIIRQLGQYDDPAAREAAARDELTELEDGIRELEERMHDRRWRVGRGAMSVLLPTALVAGIEGLTAAADVADAVEHAITVRPLIAVPILAKLAHATWEHVRDANKERHALESQPLAYAVFAQRGFGTPSADDVIPAFRA